MELLYIWIDDYRNFKETEIHLSDKFKFCYSTEELTLTCNEGMNSSFVFWDEHITNLSVIVGDNGAGKTTILKCIIEHLTYEGLEIASNCFFVFFDKSSKKIKIFTSGKFVCNLNVKNNIESLDDPEIFSSTGDKKEEKCLMPELKSSKVIYIQNVLDSSDYLYEKYGQIYDFSIGGLIGHDYKNNAQNGHIEASNNMLINYFNNEIYRQVDFVQSYESKNLADIIPFNMPNKIQISFVNNTEHIKKTCEKLENYAHNDSENLTEYKVKFFEKVKKLVYIIVDITENLSLDNKQKWYVILANNLLINALKEIALSPVVSDDREDELFCFFKAYEDLNKSNDILSFCDSFFTQVEKELASKKSLYTEWITPYKEFIYWLNRNYKEINFDFSQVNMNLLNNSYFLVDINEDNRKLFDEFFDLYRRTCGQFYYLNFSWGLSSGENNLLSLYSRLFSTLKIKTDGSRGDEVINNFSTGEIKCNNILLLIDEADLSYHPEWQRNFIYSLLRFLASVFYNCNVQVILTTHSPIILSDVPRSNVTYLKQGKNDSDNLHMETFGQNIYTLFNDAFFFERIEK